MNDAEDVKYLEDVKEMEEVEDVEYVKDVKHVVDVKDVEEVHVKDVLDVKDVKEVQIGQDAPKVGGARRTRNSRRTLGQVLDVKYLEYVDDIEDGEWVSELVNTGGN